MIKHDNIVPSSWPGSEDSTGVPSAQVGLQIDSTVTGTGTARQLGAVATGAAASGVTTTVGPTTIQRLLVNDQYQTIELPPPPQYQLPGNSYSTDYTCGFDAPGARDRAIEISNPSYEAPATVDPIPVEVAVLNVFAKNDSLPLGYDDNAPVNSLVVGTDFYINLRIRPSIGLSGFDPTIFTLESFIGGTLYGSSTGFSGWAAGDTASNWRGAVYRIPGSYLGDIGVATLTASAGQPTVNSVFGKGSITVTVVRAVETVTANVEQDGWYRGIITANIDAVYQGQALKLVVNGPPSLPYTYSTPWATGSSTTDANGQDTVDGTALQAGTFEFTVTFDGIPPYTKPFQVLNGATDTGGDAGGFSSDNANDDGAAEGGNTAASAAAAAADAAAADAAADGPGGDGDGGDGDGGDGSGTD